jgi:hypothetical protein
LAMASTVSLYLAAYFTFPMSKVLSSSPSTFVTNYFLIGPAALVDLRNFFAPGCGLRHILSFFFSLHDW